jgi:serine/threonine-protein kinase
MAAGGPLVLGRYALEEPIASGGMATIYLGRQAGAVGFSRLVAIKRLHPQFAGEPDFMAMFLDEARLAARVRHPNVVETLDVVREGAETFIVLEYVDGESLAGLAAALRDRGERMPIEVAVGIVSGLCRGLHAAHEARGPDGAALGIVHRDVSPQNVLVGADGTTRVADFGVALANVRLSHTRAGQVKGKPAYMAPEQLSRDEVTRATDIYAAGVVLWELCAGRRAYDVTNEGALYARVMTGAVPQLADVAPWVPPALAQAVHRALRREPSERYGSALQMADAIEQALAPAPAAAIGALVERLATQALFAKRQVAERLDRGAAPASGFVVPSPPDSGAPHTGNVPAPPPSLRPVGLVPQDRGDRGTHTVTSPRGLAAAPAGRGALVAIVLAILAAGGLGVAATWFVLRSNGGAETKPSATADSPREDPPVEVVAPTSATPPPPTSGTAEAPPTPPTSTATGQRTKPPRSASGTPATSAPRNCDPPYFIDEKGIQRVKRECF